MGCAIQCGLMPTRDYGTARNLAALLPFLRQCRICRILDEMSKDHPLGPTYQALWAYTWDNNAFVRLNKIGDLAFAAGFTGQRGERTLLDRLKRLAALSFIEIKPSGNDRLGFIFIPNPHAVIFAHRHGKAPPLPANAGKGLAAHFQENTFNAFLARALELGCKDVKDLLADQDEEVEEATKQNDAVGTARTRPRRKAEKQPAKLDRRRRARASAE
jgi:hypothetical protein